jgi:hypothetical protein
MSTIGDMFSACAEWMDDWISAHPPDQLIDKWDVERWMESDMVEAIEICITTLFTDAETKIDAIEVIRSLCWNYYQSRKKIIESSLVPSLDFVARIKSLPQTPQKTVEWMRESYDLLTGHEFAEVVQGTPAARSRVIQKKCKPMVDRDDQICFVTPPEGKLTPFQWGWRYEPVVRMIFEQTVGPIDDTLGRIRHPLLPRLAASPDGIITTGERAGRLVEIKSPISRKLTQSVPSDYWCQMQLQAEVCDINAVEYIEIRFGLGPPPTPYEYNYVGVVSVVGSSYVYSPILKSFDEYTPPTDALEVCQWHILDMHTETVLRNRIWWKEVGHPAYEAFWLEVDEERKKPVGSGCLFVD